MNVKLRAALAVLSIAVSVLAGVRPARADVTIVVETEEKAGTAIRKGTTTRYYTATKFRSDTDGKSIGIVDVEKERIIMLVPAMKAFAEQSFEQFIEMFADSEPAAQNMEVEETEETEEISGYKCRKVIYRFKVLDAEVVKECWLTSEVELDPAWKALTEAAYAKLKDCPRMGLVFATAKADIAKGLFAVRIVTYMKTPLGAGTSTETVTKIEEGELDDSLFEIPEGYRELRTLGSDEEPSDQPKDEG